MKTKTLLHCIGIACILVFFSACISTQDSFVVGESEKQLFKEKKANEVRIANDSIEYEVIIIEPGFQVWLNSIAKPRNFYSQSYLEARNQIYISEYNYRVLQPLRYGGMMYELRIDYNYSTNYGYEVNYLLYNYFIYFQRKYKQRLGSFYPRI